MRLVLRPPPRWWATLAYGHERRRETAQALRLTMACDLPVYGLGDEWDGSREVRIGYCRTSFRKGPLGLRLQDGPVVVDEVTAHHEGARSGGVLNVTSRRHQSGEPDRDRLVTNFLSTSWVFDNREPATADGAEAIGAARTAAPGLQAAVDGAWVPRPLGVDGRRRPFDWYIVPGHWLALGTLDGHYVSIEGHGFPADDVALSLVTDLPHWVKRPGSHGGSRLVELGDRLGDLIGLP